MRYSHNSDSSLWFRSMSEPCESTTDFLGPCALVKTKCHGEGKYREETCMPQSSPRYSQRFVEPANPH